METDGEYRLQVKVGVKNTLRRAGIPDKGGVSAEKQDSMLSCNKKSRVIFHVKL